MYLKTLPNITHYLLINKIFFTKEVEKFIFCLPARAIIYVVYNTYMSTNIGLFHNILGGTLFRTFVCETAWRAMQTSNRARSPIYRLERERERSPGINPARASTDT